MKVPVLIEFTDFMMNVNNVTVLNFGKHLRIVLIVYRLLLLLMKKYFVVMEDCHLNLIIWI